MKDLDFSPKGSVEDSKLLEVGERCVKKGWHRKHGHGGKKTVYQRTISLTDRNGTETWPLKEGDRDVS